MIRFHQTIPQHYIMYCAKFQKCYLHKAIHISQILTSSRDVSMDWYSIIVLSLTIFLSVLSHLGEYQLLNSVTITISYISVTSASLSYTLPEDRWKWSLAPFFQQICFSSSLWTYLKITNNSSKCLPTPFNSKCRCASPEFTLHLSYMPTQSQPTKYFWFIKHY